MSSTKPPLILIAGPTASGKSALAIALAQQIHGVIVNADSAQIYRDLRILSAAPGANELEQADHRLFGVVDGAVACSAKDWAVLAKREIADVQSQGRTPILVGGTGLYIRTLLDGIAPVPAIDPEVRVKVRSASLQTNRKSLEKLDPKASAQILPSDTARTNRALEVVLSTGRSLIDWHTKREGGIGDMVHLTPFILLPPRDWLYQRCNDRFAHMVDEGALGEVKALLGRELDPNLPVMRAIGVSELSSYLQKKCSLAEALAAGQQSTRRYAKRQYTWFAHQPPSDWTRYFEPLEQDALPNALALLGNTA